MVSLSATLTTLWPPGHSHICRSGQMWPKGWSQTHRHTQCPHPHSQEHSLTFPLVHAQSQHPHEGCSTGKKKKKKKGRVVVRSWWPASSLPSPWSIEQSPKLSGGRTVPSQSWLRPETDHSSKKWAGSYLGLSAVLRLLELQASPSLPERVSKILDPSRQLCPKLEG